VNRRSVHRQRSRGKLDVAVAGFSQTRQQFAFKIDSDWLKAVGSAGLFHHLPKVNRNVTALTCSNVVPPYCIQIVFKRPSINKKLVPLSERISVHLSS
jgi:hypothetical protein